MNKYTDSYKNQNKIVIPIMITENWIGDYDLLTQIENLNNKLQENNLNNLVAFRPLILSLDDLETFWAISTEGKESEEFIALLKIWEQIQKGNYLYSFASFVSKGRRLNNEKYLDFFKTSNLAD